MVCKDCLKYKQHKEACWFYWKEKRACSRFEDSMGERFKDASENTEIEMQNILEENKNGNKQ
ncbi:hypothetical protein COV19_01210 [Candidatus Woesearchaeota archaeon CG10_big_fil_rev_8_21_14_0_10_44_13]|nr:MAG: hypothetical protein COV19_01210 [Candidatus Woesearchaeota archaeon CG10_big_fil_rev_8_21_14_0_10_44_13]